ncbi:phage holin family protein [Paenibacillus sp. Marseille-P2973]|uniref:phage holin family protein n=1 Tax=Paenibacillus sp. Marseille-P2973 TaxID=1871032 RepID=UPI001B37D011|nr:phage holin family protein [Paenibacillus sp. Marseille-P2973]MBQ4897717.1 phage holin family protein [Paenibacillus sp. Marseille-P2973]
MNDQINYFTNSLASIFGSVMEYALGGWTILLQVLFVFAIADWITSWVAAWMNRELRSRMEPEEIIRKSMIFILVSIAHLIDGILGEGHYIRDAVIFFYLAMELLSIIKNIERMGIPMPGVLRNAAKIFLSKSGEKENDEQHADKKSP